MRRRIVAGVIGCLMCSHGVHAQNTWERVIALPGNAHVRVSGPSNGRVTGKIASVDSAGVSVVNRWGDVMRLRKGDVLLVERHLGGGDRARGARKGFLWGSALAALGTYGILLGDPDGAAKLPILYGSVIGGGIALGAVTAENTSRWILVYRK